MQLNSPLLLVHLQQEVANFAYYVYSVFSYVCLHMTEEPLNEFS